MKQWEKEARKKRIIELLKRRRGRDAEGETRNKEKNSKEGRTEEQGRGKEEMAAAGRRAGKGEGERTKEKGEEKGKWRMSKGRVAGNSSC